MEFEESFSMPFSFWFILYYYLPFLDEKKALYDKFEFNSSSP